MEIRVQILRDVGSGRVAAATSLGRDHCGYRLCPSGSDRSRLDQCQNRPQRGPLQYFNSLLGLTPAGRFEILARQWRKPIHPCNAGSPVLLPPSSLFLHPFFVLRLPLPGLRRWRALECGCDVERMTQRLDTAPCARIPVRLHEYEIEREQLG